MQRQEDNGPGSATAPPQRSRLAAINAKCRECLYDPMSPGNWRQQVAACSSANCPLHPFRPISRPKTHAAAADAVVAPSPGALCAGGPENGQFRVPIDHPAPPLESPICQSKMWARHLCEKNEKTDRSGWREA